MQTKDCVNVKRLKKTQTHIRMFFIWTRLDLCPRENFCLQINLQVLRQPYTALKRTLLPLLSRVELIIADISLQSDSKTMIWIESFKNFLFHMN